MKKIFISLGLALSVIIAGSIISCKKYMPYINEAEIPNDSTGTGGGSPIVTDCKLIPYRNGSVSILKNAANSESYEYKGLGDTTIAGIKFAKTSIKTGSVSGFQYFGVDTDGNLYMHMPKVAMTDIPAVTVKLYDVTKSVGDSWQYKYDSELMPGMGESIYTITFLDNKVDATFGGKKYTDGFRFSIALKSVMMGTDMGTVTTESDWVCGLGIYTTQATGGSLFKLATYKY